MLLDEMSVVIEELMTSTSPGSATTMVPPPFLPAWARAGETTVGVAPAPAAAAPSIARIRRLDADRRCDGIVISFVGIREAARHFLSACGKAEVRLSGK